MRRVWALLPTWCYKGVGRKVFSPCLKKVFSPCLKKVFSPCLDTLFSPCLEKVLSPCLEKVFSPCLEKVFSPCLEKVLSPCLEKVFSPCLEKVLDLRRSEIERALEVMRVVLPSGAQEQVKGTLDNVMVSKLAMFVVDNLGVECERNLFKVDFHLMFPYLLVTGVYNLSGESRGHSKLYGDGGFSLNLVDSKLVGDLNFDSPNGNDIVAKNANIRYYIDKPYSKVNFENLLGGGDAGVFINELLGYMADMILSHIRDKMDDYLANLLLDYVNSKLQGRTRGQVEGFVRAIDNGTIPFDFLL
uniref:Uncharacterized protein n=1 Tax=Timema monikensis TaxID=170555 RepID=A0A7R9HQV0_9NEOP|nr:unnamed protein product [Timema monikensis]